MKEMGSRFALYPQWTLRLITARKRKVAFLHLSVSHSLHWGVVSQHAMGRGMCVSSGCTPRGQTPPADTPG